MTSDGSNQSEPQRQMQVVYQRHAPAVLLPEKKVMVWTVREAERDPGTVRTDVEKIKSLGLTRVPTLNRPAIPTTPPGPHIHVSVTRTQTKR